MIAVSSAGGRRTACRRTDRRDRSRNRRTASLSTKGAASRKSSRLRDRRAGARPPRPRSRGSAVRVRTRTAASRAAAAPAARAAALAASSRTRRRSTCCRPAAGSRTDPQGGQTEAQHVGARLFACYRSAAQLLLDELPCHRVHRPGVVRGIRGRRARGERPRAAPPRRRRSPRTPRGSRLATSPLRSRAPGCGGRVAGRNRARASRRPTSRVQRAASRPFASCAERCA